MPILTADMSAGTLVEWRKKPGDLLRRGDIIALVETDKGLIDIEVFTSGVLEGGAVLPGFTLPVKDLIGELDRDFGPPADNG